MSIPSWPSCRYSFVVNEPLATAGSWAAPLIPACSIEALEGVHLYACCSSSIVNQPLTSTGWGPRPLIPACSIETLSSVSTSSCPRGYPFSVNTPRPRPLIPAGSIESLGRVPLTHLGVSTSSELTRFNFHLLLRLASFFPRRRQRRWLLFLPSNTCENQVCCPPQLLGQLSFSPSLTARSQLVDHLFSLLFREFLDSSFRLFFRFGRISLLCFVAPRKLSRRNQRENGPAEEAGRYVERCRPQGVASWRFVDCKG